MTIMFLQILVSVILCTYICVGVVPSGRSQPNIVFILADDLGWNDVSWNNEKMLTPGLEQLAREGVRLDQAYSQQVCTPSRAALLTGKYPFHIGRQKRALKPLQPTGLHLNLTTLPQELKNLGYNTHIVGKWHLGYCSWEYTPTRRGFDTFLGFYLGAENHFSHDRDYKTKPEDPPAFYDFRENEAVAKQDYRGIYSTSVFKRRSKEIIADVAEERDLNVYGNYNPFFLYLSFQTPHAPLQARPEILAKIPQTGNPARDIYKAMVLDMDLAIADIVKTLKSKDLYNDTIIVFTSDNGGAISHGGSNYPLRGTKGTLFEGGTRTATVVHAPQILKQRNIVSSNLVHITDWMPTILSMAGYKGNPSKDLGLDGIDQWAAIINNENVRDEMVYNLKADPISGAIRIGPHKIIFGKRFDKQGWYDIDNTALQCEAFKKDKKQKRKSMIKESEDIRKRKGKKVMFHGKGTEKKRINNVKEMNNEDYQSERIARKQTKTVKQIEKTKKDKKTLKKKETENPNKRWKVDKQKRKKDKGDNKGRSNKKKIKQKKNKSYKRNTLLQKQKEIYKQEKKMEKQKGKLEKKNAKKLYKLWKDWIPLPNSETQDIMRQRLDDCNWEEFVDSGHSASLNLIPRSDLQFGDVVELINPMLNPYNISAEDEDSEFDQTERSRKKKKSKHKINLTIEEQFDVLDIAMYNVVEDPSEKKDVKFDLPEKFAQLRSRAIFHLKNVVPADFPAPDLSGHPSNFQGYFSPGWCKPRYS